MADAMEPRERVLAALRHEETDRVPIDLGSCGPTAIHVNAYRSLLSFLGRNEEISLWDVVGQLAQPSQVILEMMGADVRGLRVGSLSSLSSTASPECVVDPWGTTWAMRPSTTCYSIVAYPLAGVTGLDGYTFPEGKALVDGPSLRQRGLQLRDEGRYAILGEVSGLIFERAQMIRGFDQFLLDLLESPTFAEDLLDHILQVETDIACTFLDAVGDLIDVFAYKDDLGMQSGPLISRAMFQQVLKPRMRKYLDAVRARTDAKIWFHSCGSVYYVIPDLIDLGIEILNPVQVSARDMEPARLKQEFGKHLCFWGGIDSQTALPHGTPHDVEVEVKRRVQELGTGGGYVLASVHNIEADVPGENVWTMFDAAQKWGRYSRQHAT
jgi:uroporphyrinogen decarboxylase